jgi:hypothetical protein
MNPAPPDTRGDRISRERRAVALEPLGEHVHPRRPVLGGRRPAEEICKRAAERVADDRRLVDVDFPQRAELAAAKTRASRTHPSGSS